MALYPTVGGPPFFFFFFFEESRPGGQTILKQKMRNYKESLVIRAAISSGLASSQTYSSLPDLERLARKWATELPTRLT